VSGYTSVTDGERAEMLATIGASSIDELFDVPAGVRLDRDLDLPDGLSEAEVYERMRALAGRNADAESEICFLGAGMSAHYAPAIVAAIVSRSEFLTPYTPYQPEISQGGLQAMFEFQTAMSELTGLPLSSAGLYEGPSTVASAGYLAIGATKRRRFATSSRNCGSCARASQSGSARLLIRTSPPLWSRSSARVHTRPRCGGNERHS